MDEIGFLTDEHVPRAVVRALRRRGIRVVTSADAGLLGAADMAYLAYAQERGHVLVTHDPDFLRLHDVGEAHAGIAYCEQGSRSIGELVAALSLMHDVLARADIAGRLSFPRENAR